VLVVGSFVAGALLSHWWDPDRGRGRRAQLRAQVLAAGRRGERRISRTSTRRVRRLEGTLRGLRSHARRPRRHVETPDDVTLAQKVRSEVLGDSRFRHLPVNVDTHSGIVRLRGELGDEHLIGELIVATRHVKGVHRVESFLHRPGEVAPNKAAALAAVESRPTERGASPLSFDGDQQ
jgi:hypothetical protein